MPIVVGRKLSSYFVGYQNVVKVAHYIVDLVLNLKHLDSTDCRLVLFAILALLEFKPGVFSPILDGLNFSM